MSERIGSSCERDFPSHYTKRNILLLFNIRLKSDVAMWRWISQSRTERFCKSSKTTWPNYEVDMVGLVVLLSTPNLVSEPLLNVACHRNAARSSTVHNNKTAKQTRKVIYRMCKIVIEPKDTCLSTYRYGKPRIGQKTYTNAPQNP